MRSSRVHYINPSSISLTPNANGSPNDVAVYIVRGARIKVYSPVIKELDAEGGDYQEWTLTGRNRRLADSDVRYTIYARLSKTSKSDGYLVFAPMEPRDGVWTDKYSSVTTSGNGLSILYTDNGMDVVREDLSYWYVRLGEVSEPKEGQRTLTLDTGILGTDQYNEQLALNPDTMPLRVAIACTTNEEEVESNPCVYRGYALRVSSKLVRGWDGDSNENLDHWGIERVTTDIPDDPASEATAWPGAARADAFAKDGVITLSHTSPDGDDFLGSETITFAITAYAKDVKEGEEDPSYRILATGYLTVISETEDVIFYATTKTQSLEEGGIDLNDPVPMWMREQDALLQETIQGATNPYYYCAFRPYMWRKTLRVLKRYVSSVPDHEDGSSSVSGLTVYEQPHIIGVFGETGELIRADIDNALTVVGVGSNGILESDTPISFVINAKIYRGATDTEMPPVLRNDGSASALIGQAPTGVSIGAMHIDGTTLSIPVTLTTGLNFTESASHVLKFRIVGTDGSFEFNRLVYHEIRGNRDSEDGVYYELRPRPNNVKKNKRGQYSADVVFVDCYRHVGTEQRLAESPTVTVSLDDGPTMAYDPNEGVSSGSFVSSAHFVWRDGGTVLDEQTVLMLADGDDGSPAPLYHEHHYAWSARDKSVDNSTPPDDVSSAHWKAAIPSNDNPSGKPYLWLRDTLYRWLDSAYVVSSVTYARMTGEKGTGIRIKDSFTHGGTDAEVAAYLSATYPNPNEGDNYINQYDGHLWVWTGAVWQNVGQIKGDAGKSSYVHVAWCNTLGTGMDWTGQTTDFTTSKATASTYRYIGILVNNDGGSDPGIEEAGTYTWNEVRGRDAVVYELKASTALVTLHADGSSTPDNMSVALYRTSGNSAPALYTASLWAYAGYGTPKQRVLDYTNGATMTLSGNVLRSAVNYPIGIVARSGSSETGAMLANFVVNMVEDGAHGYSGCLTRLFENQLVYNQTYRCDIETEGLSVRYQDFIAIAGNYGTSGYLVFRCTNTAQYYGENIDLSEKPEQTVRDFFLTAGPECFSPSEICWEEVEVNAASSFFLNLIAKNAFIKMLTGSQIVITDAAGNVIAGMGNQTIDGRRVVFWGGGDPETATTRIFADGVIEGRAGRFSGFITSEDTVLTEYNISQYVSLSVNPFSGEQENILDMTRIGSNVTLFQSSRESKTIKTYDEEDTHISLVPQGYGAISAALSGDQSDYLVLLLPFYKNLSPFQENYLISSIYEIYGGGTDMYAGRQHLDAHWKATTGKSDTTEVDCKIHAQRMYSRMYKEARAFVGCQMVINLFCTTQENGIGLHVYGVCDYDKGGTDQGSNNNPSVSVDFESGHQNYNQVVLECVRDGADIYWKATTNRVAYWDRFTLGLEDKQ